MVRRPDPHKKFPEVRLEKLFRNVYMNRHQDGQFFPCLVTVNPDPGGHLMILRKLRLRIRVCEDAL